MQLTCHHDTAFVMHQKVFVLKETFLSNRKLESTVGMSGPVSGFQGFPVRLDLVQRTMFGIIYIEIHKYAYMSKIKDLIRRFKKI